MLWKQGGQICCIGPGNPPLGNQAGHTGKNAAGHDNAIYHRDAMALAWRVKPMTQNFDDIDTLSHQTAIQTIFGVVEVRDDHGVWAKGA